MPSDLPASPLLVTRRIEEVSGIRPVTLLIASGIALIIAILMVTGIAANHLREQALATAEGELARVDGVLAEASNRWLMVVDSRLVDVSDSLSAAASADEAGFRAIAATPESGALLRRELDHLPKIAAAALVAADGKAINHAGDWPAGDTVRHGIGAALQAQPEQVRIIGPLVHDRPADGGGIILVHLIKSPAGATLGGVAALVPIGDFASLFAAVPFAHDAVIALLRTDGSTLVQYSEQPDARGAAGNETQIGAMLGNLNATIRQYTGDNGTWQIEALHALPNYPAAVVVRRSADQVLAKWAYQGLWFGAFALVLAVAIATMVYLIARQFQTHATLAAMRADKIEAEKVEIERARLAAETELLKKERLSVLGQLTATVAHELRNPLSAIRNTLFTVKELAAQSGLKLDRPLGRMERSIERCDRIISDLLEYTRHRELKCSSVRFDRWLGDILAEQSIAPPIALSSELGAGDEAVPIDPDRFRRIVINLVENAAQALSETPPDREKRITVRTSIIDRQLVLVIEDTGPGIKPENLERIFEPLFSTKTFGTGLGLPTVKQIVNQHGGIIDVESEVGSGTCVTVRMPLPAAQADVEAVAKVAA